MDRVEVSLNVRVIAVYPVTLETLRGCPHVRFRQRRGRYATKVPCRIESLDGRSIAVPQYSVPDGTPLPVFRAQLEIHRAPIDERTLVCAVLTAEPHSSAMDPEQLLLSPIFDDGHRMIFEFRRAQVLLLTRRGHIETRLVAVDSVRGIIGTKTVHRFDRRLLPLAARCVDYLAGRLDLFPAPPPRDERGAQTVPDGEANLSFGGRPATPGR